MGLLIHDGLTLDGKVPKRGRIPEVTFRYRPALDEDVREYHLNYNRSQTGAQQRQAVINLLKAHLVSWDQVEDGTTTDLTKVEKGSPIPITPETLRRVPSSVLVEMVNFVTGYPPDEQDNDAKN